MYFYGPKIHFYIEIPAVSLMPLSQTPRCHYTAESEQCFVMTFTVLKVLSVNKCTGMWYYFCTKTLKVGYLCFRF